MVKVRDCCLEIGEFEHPYHVTSFTFRQIPLGNNELFYSQTLFFYKDGFGIK